MTKRVEAVKTRLDVFVNVILSRRKSFETALRTRSNAEYNNPVTTYLLDELAVQNVGAQATSCTTTVLSVKVAI